MKLYIDDCDHFMTKAFFNVDKWQFNSFDYQLDSTYSSRGRAGINITYYYWYEVKYGFKWDRMI